MAKFSRKCVPFTPFDGDLSKSTVAIVTAAGVHRKHQMPLTLQMNWAIFRIV